MWSQSEIDEEEPGLLLPIYDETGCQSQMKEEEKTAESGRFFCNRGDVGFCCIFV